MNVTVTVILPAVKVFDENRIFADSAEIEITIIVCFQCVVSG